MKINVGFLVSYDYELLKTSIPLVYKHADKIVLALDKNLQTWSGNYFSIDDSFFEWVKQIDTNNKISFFREIFFIPTNTTMQNETRERNMLSKEMGDGFCIQLDADEFVLNFKELTHFLKNHETKLTGLKTYQVCAYFMDIYKQTNKGFLFVKKTTPYYIGTNHPDFIRARKNRNQQKWYIPFVIIHLTWGRSTEELQFKLKNWGHNIDFDVNKYLEFWTSIDETNYMNHHYFHPLNKKDWKDLIFIKGKNISEIIEFNNFPRLVPQTKRKLKNLGQTIKFIFSKNQNR